MAEAPRTWILTGSQENYEATRERDFTVIGMKERRLRMAQAMEPGDRIVLYLTKVMRFAAAVRLTSEMFEDRTKIWPGKPGKVDPYPWRFETELELVLAEDEWVPAEELKGDLEHVRKWPADHWTLAFQGQLRTVSEADAALLMDRMRAAAGAAWRMRRSSSSESAAPTARSCPWKASVQCSAGHLRMCSSWSLSSSAGTQSASSRTTSGSHSKRHG